jgi:hypothetical protein
MREPSQAFINIQANIKRAKDDLYALSRVLASWKKFNEAAATQLASAASCGGRRCKVQEDGSRCIERD